MTSPTARTVALATLALLASGLATAALPWSEPVTQIPCPSANRCPDLYVDPVKLRTNFVETRSFASNSCSVREGHVPSPGAHKLLKFTFTTPNVGTGNLHVGRPSDHPEWFEFGTCHGHAHFREYADYRLWTPAGYAAWHAARATMPFATAEEVLAAHPDVRSGFVAGDKRGFCVIDITVQSPVPSTLVAVASRPEYRRCDFQGVTVGWADEYHHSLDGQWIVVDDVPPGAYVLEAEVNAERLYDELDYANNAAAIVVDV